MANFTGKAGNDKFTGTSGVDTFDLSQGGHDTAIGKGGDDVFMLGGAFDADDKLSTDPSSISASKLVLDGDTSVTLKDTTIRNIYKIELAAGHDYRLVFTDANFTDNPNRNIFIDGSALLAGDTMNIDLSKELGTRGYIYGGAGNDIIKTGQKGNYISAGAGNNTVTGGAGWDQIFADGDGQNTFRGLAGNDDIAGSYGKKNTLDGGSGDDEIRSYGVGDILIGGSGNDSVFINRSAATANLTIDGSDPNKKSVIKGDGGYLSGFEIFEIITGSGNDTITTGTGNDRVEAKGGNNTISTGDGDDTIELSYQSGNNKINSGRGNDTIYGSDGISTIDAGDGNDRIVGGQGRTTIKAGAGQDNIVSFGTDKIDGGDGIDYLHLDRYLLTANLTFKITDTTKVATMSDGTTVVNVEGFKFSGGSGNDTITLGDAADYILGGGGNNTLYGGGGNDTLEERYQTGFNKLYGGDGNDKVISGSGGGVISGGAGNDTLESSGPDAIDGGTDSDTLTLNRSLSTANLKADLTSSTAKQSLGDGTTIVNVEAFVIYAGSGNDTITGGRNNDRIYGGEGTNTLNGGDGNDEVSVEYRGGTNTLLGGRGDDLVIGGTGKNTLSGGFGNDKIESYGLDVVDGGSGVDQLEVDLSGSAAKITFDGSNLAVRSAIRSNGVAGTTVTGVEGFKFYGGTGDDTIIGGVGRDQLFGNGGTNRMNGGSGADRLISGTGTNTLLGGTGDDQIESYGHDTVDGGSGYDVVTISRYGTTGLTLDASKGGKVTLVGDGSTFINAEAFIVTTGSGNDRLTGGMFRDVLNGGDGNNQLFGGDGNDTLKVTGSGTNTLSGGAGNDVLTGGTGRNTLTGGSGDDTIYTNGIDTIDGGSGTHDVLYYDRGLSTSAVVFDGSKTGTVTLAGGTTVKNVEAFVVTGGSGNDKLTGGNGDDTLDAKSGSNTLIGGNGNDTLRSRNDHGAKDFLDGGAGDDILYAAGYGLNTLIGGAGNDEFHVSGPGSIDGGSGIDKAFLTVGSIGFSGWTLDFSNSTIKTTVGTTGLTVINVEAFNVGGTNFADKITGGSGNDELFGLDGDDKLDGGKGNDILSGGIGDDTLIGGDGIDTAVFDSGGLATANLATGKAYSIYTGSDTLSGIENLLGSFLSDIFTGDDKANVLNGGQSGSDVLNGGGGDDRLLGLQNNQDTSRGSVTIDGGSGRDHAEMGDLGVKGAVTFNFKSSNVVTQLVGTDQTVIHVETFGIHGGKFDDHLTTGNGNDALFGDAGNDVLNGGGGNDFLYGEHGLSTPIVGDDILNGGSGNDTLMGDFGRDLLTGGSGRDTFRYGAPNDSTSTVFDTITDFDAAADGFIFPEQVTKVDAAVTKGALNDLTLDDDLGAALSKLGEHHAVLFTASSGDHKGEVFLAVDANGIAGYQASQDHVIRLDDPANLAKLSVSNFHVPLL